jgi:hypothetical protein
MKRVELGMVDVYTFDQKEIRPCGECRACCTTIGVQELHKRNYRPCVHECDKGCAIYGNHPPSCKQFNCWWKADMVAGLQRPDKCGIIVDSAMTAFGGAVVRVWEHKPGALNWKSNRKMIDKLRRRYALVIEGTAETWGKIWIEDEDAPQQFRDWMQSAIDAGTEAICKAYRYFDKEKEQC